MEKWFELVSVGGKTVLLDRHCPDAHPAPKNGKDARWRNKCRNIVLNQGSPIPGDVLPMLFEPFRRGVPKNNSPRGLGLGLYIVQQIVLAHDGAIGVDPTAKDGTTVTVQLPQAPTSPMVREGGKSAA